MSTYRMNDGTVIDTERATQYWREDSYHDGNNHISRATGTQWDHQTLYRSRKGRYYVEHTSQWQGRRPHVEWQSPEDAARWLLHNEHQLPQELQHLEDEVIE